MNKLAAILAMLALSAPAFAKTNFTNKEMGNKVRAAAQAKDLTVARVHAKGLGYTPSGRYRRAISVNGNGITKEWVVGKRGAIAENTKLVDQSTARAVANLALRRERGEYKGTFSGATRSGLSASGKSYVFTSKTDRSEKAYVSVKTGKLVTATK